MPVFRRKFLVVLLGATLVLVAAAVVIAGSADDAQIGSLVALPLLSSQAPRENASSPLSRGLEAANAAPPVAFSNNSEVSARSDVFLSQALCEDGIVRVRNSSVRRFLTTAKIHRKYGLTNVLLIAASMFAYAGLDNRGVVFPSKSPVNVEDDLLDLARTEQCLAVVNVLLEPKSRVDRLQLQQKSAWRLGLHLGDRRLAGSTTSQNASALLGKHRMNMGLTQALPILSYGDFFLRFPFFAIRPLDVCFFLKRMAFQRRIEQAALQEVRRMREVHGVQRYMAVHLRLEPDAAKLDKRLTAISTNELIRFWVAEILPLAAQHRVDGIYVCAGGEMDAAYWQALQRLTPQSSEGGGADGTAGNGMPLLRVFRRDKTSPPPMSGTPPDHRARQTTSHGDAAVDLLVAQRAHVAVSTERSTFLLAILSRRCPSPSAELSFDAYRNSTLYHQQPLINLDVARKRMQRDAFVFGIPGVWSYQLLTDPRGGGGGGEGGITTLSSLSHIGCDKPWQGHCFYPASS